MHNGWVPRDFWLEEWEKQAIVGFRRKNPLEGYRRLTFMMLDADIVAVSPSSVWRLLSHRSKVGSSAEATANLPQEQLNLRIRTKTLANHAVKSPEQSD